MIQTRKIEVNASDVTRDKVLVSTYSIVDVGAAANDRAIIDDTHFAVHVQLLLDDVGLFGLWVALPGLVGHLTPVQHAAMRYGILAVETIVGLSLLDLILEILELAQSFLLRTLVGCVVLLVIVGIFAHRWVHTFTHDGLCDTALDILVCDIGLLLELLENGRFVDSIISAQGEHEDVF